MLNPEKIWCVWFNKPSQSRDFIEIKRVLFHVSKPVNKTPKIFWVLTKPSFIWFFDGTKFVHWIKLFTLKKSKDIIESTLPPWAEYDTRSLFKFFFFYLRMVYHDKNKEPSFPYWFGLVSLFNGISILLVIKWSTYPSWRTVVVLFNP